MIAVAAQRPESQARQFGLGNAAILVAAGILATTLAQPGVLSGLPLRNMIKNEMHLSRSATSAFFFLIGLPWYFKPLAGILTDAFPILGSRRKTYLLVSAAFATLVWIAIAFTPHRYVPLLWMSLLLSVFMMVASTVVGGFMVEAAQARGTSGRLSSVREATQRVVTVIVGPTSGFLASIAFVWVAGISGAVIFLLIPIAWVLMREPRVHVESEKVIANAAAQLKNIARARTLWAAAGLTLLVYIAPGFATALFYRQQNELHMTTQAQGFLGLIAGVCGFAGAFCYAWSARRLNLAVLLSGSLSLLAVITLGFLFYHSVIVAQALAAVGGFSGALVEIALFDLAVRATPGGSEGLGFALMVSVRNLAVFGTDWLGSALLDSHRVTFDGLVWINVATTLLCVPLVFLLPKSLIRRNETQMVAEVPAPLNQLQE